MSLSNRLVCRYFASTKSSKNNTRTKWKSVVGLEVHAQLETKSKLFSGARSTFGAAPNTCVSLFDASIPGTLPVLNKSAVELGVKTALALGCEVNSVSMFDRKHYFYADLPTGYQITQQRSPLARRGSLSFPVFIPGITKVPYYKSARLHQLQLEQDSGKSLHDPVERKSLVDLNRAGVALMELVFEPDLESGEEASALVKELILILTRLRSCSCKMEEGALRVDANISVHMENTPLGTRTEVKNIGSVRAVSQAVDYEIQRQINILNDGGTIHNETRAWDATRRITVAMRDKEVVQDYRFMPEPNLPPLHLKLHEDSEEYGGDLALVDVPKIQNTLPELPEETRQRIIQQHQLTPAIAITLVNDIPLHDFYRAIVDEADCNRSPKMVANFLINELLTVLNSNKLETDECRLTSGQLAKIVDMLEENKLNAHYARLVLQELLADGVAGNKVNCPVEMVTRNNWLLITDEEQIRQFCKDAMERNPKVVEKYRKGKEKMLYALAGEVAKASEQKIDMARAVEMLKDMLK
ncbi:glutamyl-tRNA(Gln) amidotransferase subunit B, mitochondrial [Anopheles ziemanni]|uniref:glutamyl-tRNA(Gln) amidotransferase subunit B, mitochondrial n=1 Tax=Anopheles coustani TaxID=139045 RepID=UPI00265903A4|nr:glutamyl-tRNA(Gln) amidotransferase subunit B, mitochondrial [Anopheles coustani]XP_058172476.1 glutamyl-tRNA(Gln) amidotransferase subunit B, mitochondrial [Anopheles ziemanni]